jgi:hypothetical protein
MCVHHWDHDDKSSGVDGRSGGREMFHLSARLQNNDVITFTMEATKKGINMLKIELKFRNEKFKEALAAYS